MLSKVLRVALLFSLYGLVFVSGMAEMWVELRAPRFVVHHRSATLHCDHNVGHAAVDKVVFYKDGQRIMKFVKDRDPQYEIANITFAEHNLLLLNPNSLTLERLDFSASGKYACEVAIETPLYSKLSKLHELTVIVRQTRNPKIKLARKKLSPNDYLDATCHSGPAHPPPHLTWFINNNKVDERLTTPHGTENGRRRHHGKDLYSTSASLHFPLASLQLVPNQTVDVTCLSTIPTYTSIGEEFADIMNHTINVLVRVEAAPTHLPVKVEEVSQLSASTACCLKTTPATVLAWYVALNTMPSW